MNQERRKPVAATIAAQRKTAPMPLATACWKRWRVASGSA